MIVIILIHHKICTGMLGSTVILKYLFCAHVNVKNKTPCDNNKP